MDVDHTANMWHWLAAVLLLLVRRQRDSFDGVSESQLRAKKDGKNTLTAASLN